jgi:hypothetical protein
LVFEPLASVRPSGCSLYFAVGVATGRSAVAIVVELQVIGKQQL